MILDTIILGEIEVSDEKIIHFGKGLPGFEELHNFVLLNPEKMYPILFLQSVENSKIALPVINPFNVNKDYSPSVYDADLEELKITDAEDVILLNVMVVPADKKKMTVNMVAPIIINIKKLLGKQVILQNNQYSVREPLYDIFIGIKNGGAKPC